MYKIITPRYNAEFLSRSLLNDMLKTLMQYPCMLALSVTSTIMYILLEPRLLWSGKQFIDHVISYDNPTFETRKVVTVVALLIVWAMLKFIANASNKIYGSRIVIALQRVYYSRRPDYMEDADHVSRILWDANKARKAMEIIYLDVPSVVITTISVIGWQMAFAPEWLGALCVTVLPACCIVTLFGRFIQRAMKDIACSTNEMTRSVIHKNNQEINQYQESVYRGFIRFESSKAGSEVLMQFMVWIGLLIVYLLQKLSTIHLIPDNIHAGDIIFFIAQIKLLSKPLSGFASMYNKYCESRPSCLRIYRPEDELIYLQKETKS